MSQISKQALLVDNNQSFPTNNAGEITPSDLRAFNVNMIDSNVNQSEYTTNSGSWNVSISNLNTFTASQQPSFNALNSFTASQLTINTGVNTFTQSATGRLNNLESTTSSLNAWSSSINEISDNGILQGNSTRLSFYGLVSASIVQNINGNIAVINIEQDGTKLNTSSFNSYTASAGPVATGSLLLTSSYNTNTNEITFIKGDGSAYKNTDIQDVIRFNTFTASMNSFTSSTNVLVNNLNVFSASQNTKNATLAPVTASLIASASADSTKFQTLGLLTGSYATTGSNRFSGSQIITGSVSGNSTALTIAAGATTMDMSKGNFFTLTLQASSTTTLSVSNVSKGQTVNLLVTQASPTTGSLLLSGIKQPQYNFYTASTTAGAQDIITFVTFDSPSVVYATSVKNLL
jgi:hypothetical protein